MLFPVVRRAERLESDKSSSRRIIAPTRHVCHILTQALRADSVSEKRSLVSGVSIRFLQTAAHGTTSRNHRQTPTWLVLGLSKITSPFIEHPWLGGPRHQYARI